MSTSIPYNTDVTTNKLVDQQANLSTLNATVYLLWAQDDGSES